MLCFKVMSCVWLFILRWWSTMFTAAEMGFVEGNYSIDSGWGGDDSVKKLAMGRGTWSFSPAGSHLLCCLAPNRPQMGAVFVWGWWTPVLRQYLLACYYEKWGWVLGQYPPTPLFLPIFPTWWYQKLWLNQYLAFMLLWQQTKQWIMITFPLFYNFVSFWSNICLSFFMIFLYCKHSWFPTMPSDV